MSSRLRHVAVVNEQIAADGVYRTAGGSEVSIRDQLRGARAGTVSYTPDRLDELVDRPAPGPGDPRTEVTAEGSIEAARRLHTTHSRVGVLTFASARNPGGGYLRGARAQEEDLCRSALLYTCLTQAPDYYAAHRQSDDLRYSHRVIVSPDVPVIRDDRGELAPPFPVTFLTAPAPNAGQLARRADTADLGTVLAQRAERVIATAARHDIRALVLGAWGCGVFANDPAVVAAAFDTALRRWGAAFDHVVFAVYDRDPASPNREAFESRFAPAR
ncbi:TIGR02452 family protein [Nocardia sp. NPDC056064]|uniref:TIGR02452 family protein n=1 Tax=Nocardia sp. NPDC056064 TaxID=3345701 RepID=UPI0035E33749